ncbi:MAG: copper-translocating P-type ATPase [Candidatus Handelsmanbacteria bacterium]|nr:copper-translocating P-type ATPase [Candidatus Handelsmanbacteria bacterium]
MSSEPALQQHTLAIGGMTCAACSARVERRLSRLEGVKRAVVNLSTEEAVVEFEPGRVKVRDLRWAVEEAGYQVVEADREERQVRRQDELREQRHSLIAVVLFALPLFLVEMGEMLGLPLPEGWMVEHHPLPMGWVQLALVLPVMAIAWRIYAEGLRSLVRGGPNMFSLIAVGTLAALGFSLWGLWEVVAGWAHTFDSYFPAVSTILAFVLLGRFLEARSKRRAGVAIQGLMNLQPKMATLVETGGERQIPAAQVEAGDLLRVRPGERVPADGEVVEGFSAVDESLLSGESLPVAKKPGDRVVGGSINREGSLLFRARQVGRDTVLAQILRLVEEAQQGKAPIARLADLISGYFVPAVMALALVAGGAWLLAGAGLGFAIEILVSVLIIACPCSLGLATPAAIMVGTGRGAQMGVLFKSPEALEAAHRLDTIVLDKTGTITEGKPALTEVIPLGEWGEEEVLRAAAGVEQGSEHLLAVAVREAAKAKRLVPGLVAGFVALPGRGARAEVEGRWVVVGNPELLAAAGIQIGASLARAEALAEAGKTPVWVGIDGRLAGLLAFSDLPRPTSAAAIAQLQDAGLRVVMLSGDHPRTVAAIARQVGIEEFHAQVQPAQKAEVVRQLQASGQRVGMVGDGINDAPALAQAEVGIAIAAGADLAMESADLVLMHNRLEDVALALRLSRAVMRTIRQNLFWAFLYNTAGLPVAAGVLHLWGGPLLDPMLASMAMAFSSVSVVGNALRLRRFAG